LLKLVCTRIFIIGGTVKNCRPETFTVTPH